MAIATTTHSLFASTSLSLELRVLGAKNVETKHKGNLFIRIYLASKSVHINTKEIKQSSKKDDYLFWDEIFSLECNGTNETITNLRDDNLVVELRWRKSNSFLGKTSGSHLLARAELPWKNVFESQNMEIQKWVPLIVADYSCRVLHMEEGANPPALQLAIKARVPAGVEEKEKKKRNERLKYRDECGCCKSCADNELLFVAEALEAF